MGYEPESKTVTFDLVEETDDDTENFGPLSGEESDSDDDNSDNDTDDTLFDEESDSDSDEDVATMALASFLSNFYY